VVRKESLPGENQHAFITVPPDWLGEKPWTFTQIGLCDIRLKIRKFVEDDP
jgi:hypothetical protein